MAASPLLGGDSIVRAGRKATCLAALGAKENVLALSGAQFAALQEGKAVREPIIGLAADSGFDDHTNDCAGRKATGLTAQDAKEYVLALVGAQIAALKEGKAVREPIIGVAADSGSDDHTNDRAGRKATCLAALDASENDLALMGALVAALKEGKAAREPIIGVAADSGFYDHTNDRAGRKATCLAALDAMEEQGLQSRSL